MFKPFDPGRASSMPSKPVLSLRRATPADLDPVTTLVAAAYSTDPFYAWLHPNSAQYPNDFRASWEHKIAEWIADRRLHMLVCETTTGDGDEKEIVGVAQWIRQGKGREEIWEENGWQPGEGVRSNLAQSGLARILTAESQSLRGHAPARHRTVRS